MVLGKISTEKVSRFTPYIFPLIVGVSTAVLFKNRLLEKLLQSSFAESVPSVYIALVCLILVILLINFTVYFIVKHFFKEKADIYYASISFLIAGYLLISNSYGLSLFHWMIIYEVEDFVTIQDIVSFYSNLKIPIPPFLSFVEIFLYHLSIPTILTVYGYRLAILISYLILILISNTSRSKLYFVTIISLFLTLSTAVVHKGNPQTYDVFFPFFVLLSIYCVHILKSDSSTTKQRILAGLAGFSATMAELTRPIYFPIFIIFILLVFIKFLRSSRSILIFFLVPVIVFSGIWHIYIFLAHNQIIWSNNGGFNMYRLWSQIEYPPLIQADLLPEINSNPLKEGRWPNLNTFEHSENSKRQIHAITQYIIVNPVVSIEFMIRRYVRFLFQPEVNLYSYKPTKSYLPIYRLLVIFLSFTFLSNLFHSFLSFAKSWKAINILVLTKTKYILLILTFLISFLTAIGDYGEDSRFLISVLPLITVSAMYQESNFIDQQESSFPTPI